MSGFGNYDDDNGADKPGRCSAGRGSRDAGAAGPAAGPGEWWRGPGGCGHHIMLACAARREVRGLDAMFSPPGTMYTYNSDRGLSGTRVRCRRDDDGDGEARIR